MADTHLSKAALTQAVKAEANRLGFQLAGITSADPPGRYGVYRDWLSAGHHGQMTYLEGAEARSRRADPRRILPECRSILCLGIRYPSPEPESGAAGTDGTGLPNRGRGRVASYAWGDDYHEVLRPRLHGLVRFLEALVNRPIPNRWYTDTGPILERDLAERAGLGWIGKNTCLIHPGAGSYFLLAEILLGIELVPDAPFPADRCGSCTRCIEACPTDCILPDRTIDARACISYLTIEQKGPIPADLRPPIGDWIFGCDICQQVCPWNLRFAAPQVETAFTARPGLPRPELVQELALTGQAFNRKFKGSPVKRAKRRGYLRNVAVALGNSGDPGAVPALRLALLDDPEPLVRGHAAWALGQLGSAPAEQALLEASAAESDLYVRAEIAAALQPGGGMHPAN